MEFIAYHHARTAARRMTGRETVSATGHESSRALAAISGAMGTIPLATPVEPPTVRQQSPWRDLRCCLETHAIRETGDGPRPGGLDPHDGGVGPDDEPNSLNPL